MKKILIAYFSPTGTTKIVAEKIAQVVKGDLFEITPKELYTPEDLDWHNPYSRSSKEMKDKNSRPLVKNEVNNMSDYNTILVGFPIWWYQAPTIINTFLESYDLTNITIIPFATSGGSGMGRTNDFLKVSCPTANLLDGRCLNSNISLSQIKAWLETIK